MAIIEETNWKRSLNDSIKRLAIQCDLNLCIQCGICSASCPMGSIYKDYTKEIWPRRIVQKAILYDWQFLKLDIWHCLTCRVCSIRCRQGVRFREFIKGLREILMNNEVMDKGHYCRQCKRYFITIPAIEFIHKRVGNDMDICLIEACPQCRKRLYGERHKNFSKWVPSLIKG
jgi:heterodisulfide reductase subunit C